MGLGEFFTVEGGGGGSAVTRNRLSPEKVAVAAIVLIAAVLCFWEIRWHLPSTLQPDEHNIVLRALRFGTGDLNPHFFVYGSLTMYLCFLLYGVYFAVGFVLGWFPDTSAFAVSYFVDPTPFYLIARSLSAFSAVLTVLLTYYLGKRLVGTAAGLAGALSMTFFAEHAVQAHYAKPTVPATALLALAYVAAISPARTTRCANLRLVAVGLCSGLACSAHFLAAFGALLAGLLALCRHWAGPRALVIQTALLGSGGLLGFAIGEPFFFLDFATAKAEVLGWTPGFHSLPFLHAAAIVGGGVRDNLGWVGCVLALMGAGKLLQTRRSLGVIVVMFMGGFLVFLTRGFTPHRYVLMVAPVLCVLVGIGFGVAWRQLRRFNPTAKVVGAAVLVTLTFMEPAARTVEAVQAFGEPDTRVSARGWILENIPAGSHILLVGADSNLPRLIPNRQSIDELKRALEEASASNRGRYPHIQQYYSLMGEAADAAREPTYWILRIREAWWAESEDASGLVSRFGFVPPNIPPESELIPRPLNEYRDNLGVEYIVTVDYLLKKYDNSKFPSIQRLFADVREGGPPLHLEKPTGATTGPTVFVWQLCDGGGPVDGS